MGEGYLLAVRGKCTDTAPNAVIGPTLAGLTLPDGEVRFDFKVTNGHDRALITLLPRLATGAPHGYGVSVAPGTGQALIGKIHPEGGNPVLARRSELGGLLRRDDWNTMSVRLSGPSIWLIVNDQPILTVDDTAFDTGTVSLGIGKTGNPDDEQEVAVVFRNLAVARIDGAPDDRAPTYVRPSGPPGSGTVLGLLPLAR